MLKFMKKNEYLLVSLFFALMVFSLLLSTGTITSGWHMVDDHEFLEYQIELSRSGGTVFTCIQKALEDVYKRQLSSQAEWPVQTDMQAAHMI